jgi:hypothetical protein
MTKHYKMTHSFSSVFDFAKFSTCAHCFCTTWKAIKRPIWNVKWRRMSLILTSLHVEFALFMRFVWIVWIIFWSFQGFYNKFLKNSKTWKILNMSKLLVHFKKPVFFNSIQKTLIPVSILFILEKRSFGYARRSGKQQVKSLLILTCD